MSPDELPASTPRADSPASESPSEVQAPGDSSQPVPADDEHAMDEQARRAATARRYGIFDEPDAAWAGSPV